MSISALSVAILESCNIDPDRVVAMNYHHPSPDELPTLTVTCIGMRATDAPLDEFSVTYEVETRRRRPSNDWPAPRGLPHLESHDLELPSHQEDRPVSERTIPEILGWERPHLWVYDHEYCTYSCHWCSEKSTIGGGFEPGDPTGCDASAPCSNFPPPQPAVDDLLAWMSQYMATQVIVNWRPWNVEVGWPDVSTTFNAPTLLAALEAAVRAIDEQETNR